MNHRYKFDDTAIVYEIIQSEVVLVHLESGYYYILDDIASEIWLALKGGATTDGVVNVLLATYAESPETIRAAVDKLVAELVQENIFQVEPAGSSDDSAAPSVAPVQRTARRAFHAPGMFKYTDMSYLIQMDPIWDYDETGWPKRRSNPSADKK